MKILIENLLQLQSLELAAQTSAAAEKQIAELRQKIPAQILGHYDRLLARGKKGVSKVHNQVCCECHMQVPRNTVLTLIRGDDIQICESCGRYLYLSTEAQATPEPVVPKSKKSARKRETKLQTA